MASMAAIVTLLLVGACVPPPPPQSPAPGQPQGVAQIFEFTFSTSDRYELPTTRMIPVKVSGIDDEDKPGAIDPSKSPGVVKILHESVVKTPHFLYVDVFPGMVTVNVTATLLVGAEWETLTIECHQGGFPCGEVAKSITVVGPNGFGTTEAGLIIAVAW